MQTILVTGANGFVGQHLVRELSEHGMTVIGVGGPIGTSKKSPYISTYFELDLTRADDVARLEFKGVDGVIHLAGLAVLGSSFDDPMRYMNTNVGIEVNMFEAALTQHANPRFIIISSGALYDPSAHLPLTEASPVLPSSPYAVSKIGQEEMARYYGSRGFESIIVRPFNHIGPGQGPGLIVPDLAQQVVAVAQGKASEVKVGNLDAKRDYTDVRDIVRAYRLLLEKGQPGEIYNICSGTPRSGHDILSGLTKAAGVEPKIVEDSAKLRPSDTPLLYGDHQKLTTDTGWQPEIPIETTLTDVIADWQSRS
ncbi:MAG TPA: NAD-dependent epimerase/dehydratase family protein [Candidatus Saccharimonadales bacterium]|nr:NAD-dependent epimerase/dehydratase family protein [Candidatus Saccharimonadales bacterium]